MADDPHPAAADGSIAATTAPPPRQQPQPKKYALSFENLSVHVPGTRKSSSSLSWRPLLRPFHFVAVEYLGMSTLDRAPYVALSNVTGLLHDGELCLVLGSNDGAKSTLLRALSGRLSSQDEMSGTLALNGHALPSSGGGGGGSDGVVNRGWRRMCPYVSPGDQDHAPVLTVRETLDFARRCTSAATATTAPGVVTTASATTDDDISQGVTRLLTTLGLHHVADTIVGDENIRGISGGQKRRVTVGEMLLPDCSFVCMENITDGLSSTDSVKLITDLATVCHTQGYSAFISLLQPSDDMVTLFDKLLVLSADGGMSYFGPVDRTVLREIFAPLGSSNGSIDGGTTSSADDDDPEKNTSSNKNNDGSSIADLVLEASLDKTGRSEDEIKRRYVYSTTSQSYTTAISQLRARVTKGSSIYDYITTKESDYPNTFLHRFRLIIARRVKLITRNSVTWTRMIIAILFGLVIGSLFAKSPNTLGGSLSKVRSVVVCSSI
jgi:ABC-type multidrug transport system ATPase subunit